MKKRISILLAAVLALSTVACGQTAEKRGEEVIEAGSKVESKSESNVLRLGTQPGAILDNVARANGYYDEEGLEVEAQIFSYGPPIIEALTSGDLDVGFMGDQPAFSGISNGLEIEIISTTSASNKRHGLIARDDSGIETLADLKGKTVSVPVGSNAQPLLYIYLDSVGLTDSDVEVVNLGVVDAETSIIAGDIDAAVVYEPHFRSVATKETGVHVVTDAEGYKDYVSISVSRKAYGQEHPEELAKLLRAWDKAAKWSIENPQEAAEIVYEADGTEVETTLLNLELADQRVSFTDSDIKALEDGVAQSIQFGLIENEFDVNDYINFEFLELAGLR